MSTKHLSAVAVGAIALGLASPAPISAQEDGCVTGASAESLAGRASPLDSVTFRIGGQAVKVCYGRPSARGRTMIGGSAVPYGQLWRTGANEPTMIHTPVALSIAGIEIEPGTYSLYTVPNEGDWGIVVNASYEQWGRENRYTDAIRAQEVGRATAPSTRDGEHVEQFTISFRSGHLIMRWETTEVRIPVGAG